MDLTIYHSMIELPDFESTILKKEDKISCIHCATLGECICKSKYRHCYSKTHQNSELEAYQILLK